MPAPAPHLTPTIRIFAVLTLIAIALDQFIRIGAPA